MRFCFFYSMLNFISNGNYFAITILFFVLLFHSLFKFLLFLVFSISSSLCIYQFYFLFQLAKLIHAFSFSKEFILKSLRQDFKLQNKFKIEAFFVIFLFFYFTRLSFVLFLFFASRSLSFIILMSFPEEKIFKNCFVFKLVIDKKRNNSIPASVFFNNNKNNRFSLEQVMLCITANWPVQPPLIYCCLK